MPLNKFIPLSPDPNITRDSDIGMAQFGHLNTIVDYLNTYVAADSLQLDGTGPLSATARYITDSAGNLSSLSISTGNVGIGTTTPTYKFMVSDNSANDGAVFFEKDLLGGQSDCYVYNKNASTNLTTGALIGTLSFGGYFNSNYSPGVQDVAAIFGFYTGTGTNRKGQLQFRTHDSSGMQSAMTINDTQLVGIGETSPTARLQIKGKGSTSATTSLLVQNSLGNAALTVTDDRNVSFGGGGTFAGGLNLGSGIIILNNGGPNTIDLRGYTTIMRLNASSSIGYFDLFKGSGYSQISSINEPIRYGAPSHLFGGTTLNYSAIVNIESTTQGFLKPRMTTAEKNLIATPAAGLEVFDTTLGRPCFYSGSAWVTL